MRTATHQSDADWYTATVFIADTPWEELRLIFGYLFGRYKRATGAMWGTVFYDPRTVKSAEANEGSR